MRLRGLQGVAQRPVDSGGPRGLGRRLTRSRGPPTKRQAFLCAVNLTMVSAEQTCLSSIWEATTSSGEVSGPRLSRACLAGVRHRVAQAVKKMSFCFTFRCICSFFIQFIFFTKS